MVLVAPRNGDCITIDELVNAVQAHASKEGYAIVKGRSKSIKGSDGFNNKVNLLCDRGGLPGPRSNNLKRKRKTSSIKIDCPFRANAIRRKGSDVWTLEIINGEHNHEATVADACSSLRKEQRDQALLNRLDAASKAGMDVFVMQIYIDIYYRYCSPRIPICRTSKQSLQSPHPPGYLQCEEEAPG